MDQMNEEIKRQFGQSASETKSEVKQEAQKIEGDVEKRAQSFLAERKERFVNQLNETANALREAGQKRENQGGELTLMSARNLERLGGYLNRRDIDDLIDDLHHYARAKPATVLGGAFAIGFATSRFLKARSRRAAELRL